MALQRCAPRFRTRPLAMLYHTPWPPSTAKAPILDATQPIEEEQSPYYHPDRFHPTRLYDVLNNQYQIVAKLGHGSGSTVWLARDLSRLICPAISQGTAADCASGTAGQQTNSSQSR